MREPGPVPVPERGTDRDGFPSQRATNLGVVDSHSLHLKETALDEVDKIIYGLESNEAPDRNGKSSKTVKMGGFMMIFDKLFHS